MANVVVEEQSLIDIASAIRTKNGTTDTYKPSEMASAISEITTSEDLTNEFNEYEIYLNNQDATIEEIISALRNKVNIEDRAIDKMIDRSITEVESNVESIGSYAFRTCIYLETAKFPNVKKINSAGFRDCIKLRVADFPSLTSIADNVFYAGYQLRSLILRSNKICTLSATNSFTNCFHITGATNATQNPNGDKDGFIYVPSALLTQYQKATNWSTYKTCFRALEDYTVDGTTTGELDVNKI